MKEYQPKKNNRYHLPNNLYMRTLYLIRDYDRMKEVYVNLPWESPEPPDGQPRGGVGGKPTEVKGVRRAVLFAELEAIEQATMIIPEEYRKEVFLNVKNKEPYPIYANYSTWRRYRQKFIYQVAKNMNWI